MGYHGPVVVYSNATTNLSGVISLYDADTTITNVGVTVTSSDTNLVANALNYGGAVAASGHSVVSSGVANEAVT